MTAKVKYEIRQDSRYCATCKTIEEAKEMIESSQYPCDPGHKYTIIKIVTEKVYEVYS